MKSDGRAPVAIVGAGASGTILAAQLAKRGIASLVIEGGGRMGKGIAYSTTEPSHLLNVPASGMSAWAGDPDHFARVFEAEGGSSSGFAERRLFGRYLRGLLSDAVASGKVRTIAASAVGASRADGQWIVELDDGSVEPAKVLALAIGNQEPAGLPVFEKIGARFIRNPWGPETGSAIAKLAESGGDGLIVGTGLTMVDLALSLDASGPNGRLLAVSRRGQVPRSHGDNEPAPVEAGDVPHGNLRALWRWVRRRSGESGWRATIDGLRPHSHRVWQSLTNADQRRFLRHARPWWDVHRHRIAPQVGSTIARMISNGRLQVMAARVSAARDIQEGIEIGLQRRGSAAVQPLRFDYAFNCTGPLHAIERTQDRLLRSLLDAGAVVPDQLGIGLESDGQARVGERLWALGPLTKGRYWEIIAVPDIRDQAAMVAEEIERELA